MTCEDFPCCGHETGDCEGNLYGSDESIMAAEYARLERIEHNSWAHDDEQCEDCGDTECDCDDFTPEGYLRETQPMEDAWLDGSYEE